MKPAHISLANLPTKIEKLASSPGGVELYIKRDDQTGSEYAGNKIRKLEFALAEALDTKCDTVITCGGIQSNHCRATAAACIRLGLQCILLLKSDEDLPKDGNYLMDALFGAEVRYVPSEVYKNRLAEHCEEVSKEVAQEGHKAYIIPIGASNAIGSWGYFQAFEEILRQEEKMQIEFDTIAVTVGSGGTYAGLCLANAAHGYKKNVVGIPIANDAEYFQGVVEKIAETFVTMAQDLPPLDPSAIHLIDGFAGRGYALNVPEEMRFIQDFARTEGIILDPVYTGKAMRGLFASLNDGHPLLKNAKKILFIHTGGLYGVFPKRDEFEW